MSAPPPVSPPPDRTEYLPLWLSLGITIGVAVGFLVHNILLGLVIGAIVGIGGFALTFFGRH